MSRQRQALYAFNRGLVSAFGLAREDIKRVAMAAQVMTNFIARVLGSMALRPGWQYIAATKSNNTAKGLPFVFSTTDTALVELTDSNLRVLINDALVTRVAVSTAITNGTFTQYSDTVTISNASPGVVTYATTDAWANNDPVVFATTGGLPNPLVAGTTYYVNNVNTGANTFEVSATAGGASINTTSAGSGVHTAYAYAYITGWTDSDQSGATSQYASGPYLELVGNGTNYAIRDQQVTVAGGDQNKEHGLRIVVTRGPVTLKVGSSSGTGDYIWTTLYAGTHSLALTPTGNFWIRLQSNLRHDVLVSSVSIEAAGTMTLPTPWLAADLGNVRADQSGDILFVACSGYQQRRIERHETHGWSITLYQPEDGPFRVLNTTTATMTPSVLSGNGTLTASEPFFQTTHVGALFSVTSTGQNVEKIVGALNDVTDSIEVTGTGDSRAFSIYIVGLSTTGDTVVLQQSFDNTVWNNVTGKSWTADTSENYNDTLTNQVVYYRLKCTVYAAGNPDCNLRYGSGSIRGICRVTSFTSTTVVNMEVLKSFGAITASTDWEEGVWSDYRGWPSSVRFHEGRLWWFGKGGIQGSVSDAYASFDEETTGDSGPLIRTIGSGPVDTINWSASTQVLLIGGPGEELAVQSSALGDPITPTSFNLKKLSGQGSAAIEAVKADQLVFFVQRGGVRVYQATPVINPYVVPEPPVDLTALVPELGLPGIVRMAIQRQPDTRIHCVRSDGTVMLGVFDKTENVVCWQELTTTGSVEDVVVLPGANASTEDQVYYAVKRTINSSTVRYWEKWAKETECRGSTLNKQADAFIVYSQAASSTITGLSHLIGASVVVWDNGKCLTDADGNIATFTVDGSGHISVTNGGVAYSATNGIVGLTYTGQWQSTKLGEAMQDGPALSRKKNMGGLGLICAYIHPKGIQYGNTFDALYDMPEIEGGAVIDGDTVRSSYDEAPFLLDGGWTTDLRLCLQAQAPRPATVLGAVCDSEVA